MGATAGDPCCINDNYFHGNPTKLLYNTSNSNDLGFMYVLSMLTVEQRFGILVKYFVKKMLAPENMKDLFIGWALIISFYPYSNYL